MCRVGVGGNPAIMNLLLQSVDVRMNSLNGNTGGPLCDLEKRCV